MQTSNMHSAFLRADYDGVGDTLSNLIQELKKEVILRESEADEDRTRKDRARDRHGWIPEASGATCKKSCGYLGMVAEREINGDMRDRRL